MQVNIDINCCAFAELTGFNDREDHDYDDEWDTAAAVRMVAVECNYENHDPDASLILISRAWDKKPKFPHRTLAHSKKRMDSLLRYIKKHKLGRVTMAPQHINPNHDSFIKSGIWAISRRNMEKWADKNIKTPNWHDNRMWRI